MPLLVLFFLATHGLGQDMGPVMDEPRPAASREIVFRGNHELTEAVLRRAAAAELRDIERGEVRRASVDDAAFQMELAYRKAGYPFARVDYSLEDENGRTIITFTVQEGHLVLLGEIQVQGNEKTDTRQLLLFFQKQREGILKEEAHPYVRSDLEAALSEIRDFYLSRGFLDVVVERPDVTFNEERTRATVRVTIHEGIQYVIREIVVTGEVVEGVGPLIEDMRREWIGQPYFQRRNLVLRGRLSEIYGHLGYPIPVIHVQEREEEDPGHMVLSAQITSGPRIFIGDMIIEGNEKTREGFIRSRIPLKPGDLYDLEKQKEGFRQLYRTGLFTRVDLRLEEEADDRAWPLRVDVQEAPSKELYLEPGWGSYEKLRVKAGFQEKNLFGTGRIFGLDGNASLKAQGLQASLTDPWFLDTEVTATLPLYYRHREEPSFTRTDKGGSLFFGRDLTDHLSVSAGYGFRMTDLSNVDPIETLADDNYDIGSVTLQATYDTRDDLFFPTHGTRSFVSAEYASQFLGGDLTFVRLTGGARYFYSLSKNTILGARYSAGLIVPATSSFLLPLGERFFNGGENTVRSFKESKLGPRDASGRPSGGLGFNILNLEVRHRLVDNLIGTIFFDLGNVSPNRTRSEQRLPPYSSRSEVMSDTLGQFFQDFRPAVGLGFQYLLPIGPARLDFAFNPSPNKDRGESLFMFHFSIGMAF